MSSVLIVEDEEDLRDLLEFNLVKEGYQTRVAREGVTALAEARARQPDLILLDVMLPGLDGFAVCEILKASPDTAGIPVIMLTAFGREQSRVIGLELGAADYVLKPFSVRELLLRVRNVIAGRAAGPAARENAGRRPPQLAAAPDES